MSITIIGSVALDTIITPLGKRKDILGGSATYAALGASFFQPMVNLVAVVGKDFPRRFISLFEKRGIGLEEGFRVIPGKTFRWKGRYSYDLNNRTTIYTRLNVFKKFNPHLSMPLRNSKFVFLANIDPVLQGNVLSQMRRTPFVICDTMNLWIAARKKELLKLIKKTDLFLLNDDEARQLSGETRILKAAKYIMAKGAKMVVIKKGEHGALFFSKYFHFLCPAYLLEAVNDPTGAGDTFAGGMVGYLSRFNKINQALLRKSLAYGSVLASFAVEDFGVNGLLKITRTDIEKRYKNLERITGF